MGGGSGTALEMSGLVPEGDCVSLGMRLFPCIIDRVLRKLPPCLYRIEEVRSGAKRHLRNGYCPNATLRLG